MNVDMNWHIYIRRPGGPTLIPGRYFGVALRLARWRRWYGY